MLNKKILIPSLKKNSLQSRYNMQPTNIQDGNTKVKLMIRTSVGSETNLNVGSGSGMQKIPDPQH